MPAAAQTMNLSMCFFLMEALVGFNKNMSQNKISADPTLITLIASGGIKDGVRCLMVTAALPKKKLPTNTAICAFVLLLINCKETN